MDVESYTLILMNVGGTDPMDDGCQIASYRTEAKAVREAHTLATREKAEVVVDYCPYRVTRNGKERLETQYIYAARPNEEVPPWAQEGPA